MVIIGLSPGLGNSIFEYAAVYALAKELKQELVIDISECIYSNNGGYLLDNFNIPDSPKIVYCEDMEHFSHEDIKRIPKELKEKAIILTQGEQEGAHKYDSLSELVKEDYSDKDIYLCGYFFNRQKYYDKYWAEIKNLFSLKVKIREVDTFRKLIKDKISVGIHIRRGDMLFLYENLGIRLEDNYYRAAIQYIRKYIGKCSFFVFSDDIAYAKEILGKDSSLWYVNFGGGQDAALAEFVCLSLCNHRILSNGSSYSMLADDLCREKDKKTLYYGESGPLARLRFIKSSIWLKIYGKSRQTFRLSSKEINKYAKRYHTDNKDNIMDYHKRKQTVFDAEITKDNCEEILEEISILSTNIYEMSDTDKEKLLYQRFTALVMAEEYDIALAVQNVIYARYQEDCLFRDNLIKALIKTGADKEAAMEKNRTRNGKRFIIIPAGKSCASYRSYGLVRLGIVLSHLGHRVSLILDAGDDETEEHYIKHNKYLTYRDGRRTGIRWHLQQEIEERGFEHFLSEDPEEQLFVITRKSVFCGQRIRDKKITFVFPDFTDDRDEESNFGNKLPAEETDFLYRNADIVLTQNADYEYNMEHILWENTEHTEALCRYDRRWRFADLDRLSVRTICMAEALIEGLKNRNLL